jgi:hypothetical protein
MQTSSETGTEKFGFGIEAEFLLLDKLSHRPLFHGDLNFEQLLDTLDNIAVADFSSDGFNIKPLHRKASPYLVEGYYLTDDEMNPLTLLAKGIELRTPIVPTIDASVNNLSTLYSRLQLAMNGLGYQTAMISHHPVESKFEAKPNYKRHDYWQWASTAMLTYGPDINISVPATLAEMIDREALHDKINFYMPSVIAMSLASPLVDGDLWHIRGAVGKSIRTYRRSLWAPLYYIHHKPSLRFEFKGFEMAQNLSDYKAFFLLSLAVLLDLELTGRASDATRLYDLGQVAVHGLDLPFVRDRASAVLEGAERIGTLYDFDTTPLHAFWNRLDNRRVPADDIIESFSAHRSIAQSMFELTDFSDVITFAPPAASRRAPASMTNQKAPTEQTTLCV